jgi:replication-associated recombination protein RarA
MVYTALARKWRPRRFAEMTGQEHVLRAVVELLNAEPPLRSSLYSALAKACCLLGSSIVTRL